MFSSFDTDMWNRLFAHRPKGFYLYESFLKAVERFTGFLNEGDDQTRIRELAAFLASISFETGWIEGPGGFSEWGLHYIEENIPESGKMHYSDPASTDFPPVADRTYHGRGPIQLSWNYNYGAFSAHWFGDKNVLLMNPDLVSEDSVISFASAIWFWMTPQYPKPSCHDIITGRWTPTETDIKRGRLPGFGAVINVINGGLECGQIRDRERTIYREHWFVFFCNFFRIPTGPHIGCSGQEPFG